jgi:hypothetical protein
MARDHGTGSWRWVLTRPSMQRMGLIGGDGTIRRRGEDSQLLAERGSSCKTPVSLPCVIGRAEA